MLNTLATLAVFLTDAQQSILVDKPLSVKILKDGVDWATRANWALVIVGVIGIIVAVCTLRLMKGQVDLMKLQSDTQINRERARVKVKSGQLEIHGKPPGTWILAVDLEIANHGSSNAYITRKLGKLAIMQIGEKLPELDDSCAMLLPYPFDIIKPETEPTHTVFFFEDVPSSLRDLCVAITESRILICLYGFIEYETMGETFHLPFKYRWNMNSIPYNASEADLAEDINIIGDWDDPSEQNNAEYKIPN